VAVGAAAVSTYISGLDEALGDRFEGYRQHLLDLPLAPATRVGGYLAWLAELDPVTRRRQGDPFTHGHARDYTVRDYRTHLIDTRKAKPASANLALAALDSFYRWVGLGPARIRRDELPQAAPRALTVEQTRRLLRTAERAAQTGTAGGVRDRAIITLLLFTGLRIGELAALDVGDVAVSARKGLVTVRRGKGDRYRQVPLNTDARDALDAWLTKRATLPGNDSPALLLSLKGQRLSTRAIDLTVRQLAQQAELQASAHTLRHTCLTRFVRAGNDIVLVAELAGHARLETTRRYSLPAPPTDRPPWTPSPSTTERAAHGLFAEDLLRRCYSSPDSGSRPRTGRYWTRSMGTAVAGWSGPAVRVSRPDPTAVSVRTCSGSRARRPARLWPSPGRPGPARSARTGQQPTLACCVSPRTRPAYGWTSPGCACGSVIPCCCWTCLRTAASLPAVPSASLRAEAWSRTVVVADWTVAYPLSTVASSLPTVPGVAADRPAVRWAHGGVVMFRGVVGAGPGKSS